MRKILVVIVMLACVIWACGAGYCQDDGGAIEQSESQMGQGLDSEIASGQAEGAAESSEANSEFSAGEAMTN